MALRKRWRIFAEAYLKEWNKTKAAEIAGYAHPGQAGYRLFKIVQIQEYIQARLEDLTLSPDEVLVRLAETARFDVGPFIDMQFQDIPAPDGEDGTITISGGSLTINWQRLKEAGLTHLVKAVYETKYGTRIEFHDPQHALELIGKHYKLFTDRIEHSGSVELKDGLTDEQRIRAISTLIESIRAKDSS